MHPEHISPRVWLMLALFVCVIVLAGQQTLTQASELAIARPELARVAAQVTTPTTTPTPHPAVTKQAIAVNGTPVAQRTPGVTASEVLGLQPGDTVTFDLGYTAFPLLNPAPPGVAVIHDYLNANFAVVTAPDCTTVPLGTGPPIPVGVGPNATQLDCRANNDGSGVAHTSLIARVVPGAPVNPPPPSNDSNGNLACPLFCFDFWGTSAVRLAIATPMPQFACSNTATGAWRLVNANAVPTGLGMQRSCSALEAPIGWPTGSQPEPVERVCVNLSTGAFRHITAGATPQGTGRNRACGSSEMLVTWPQLVAMHIPPSDTLAQPTAPTSEAKPRPLLGALGRLFEPLGPAASAHPVG